MNAENQGLKEKGNSTPRVIDIELFALDLDSCTRCRGTLDNIGKAIGLVFPILDVMGVNVDIRKIVVKSEEQAREFRFVTSPTVRINGKDIAFTTQESECDSCTELCGCDEGINCRVWSYQGKEFTTAPVGLVVESILRRIFDNRQESRGEAAGYQGIPENLQRFFKGRSHPKDAVNPCCSPAKQETCCEPGRKTTCCETSDTETCGCL